MFFHEPFSFTIIKIGRTIKLKLTNAILVSLLKLLLQKCPLNNDHLSTTATIFESRRWSLYTSLTVLTFGFKSVNINTFLINWFQISVRSPSRAKGQEAGRMGRISQTQESGYFLTFCKWVLKTQKKDIVSFYFTLKNLFPLFLTTYLLVHIYVPSILLLTN